MTQIPFPYIIQQALTKIPMLVHRFHQGEKNIDKSPILASNLDSIPTLMGLAFLRKSNHINIIESIASSVLNQPMVNILFSMCWYTTAYLSCFMSFQF